MLKHCVTELIDGVYEGKDDDYLKEKIVYFLKCSYNFYERYRYLIKITQRHATGRQ